MTKTLSAFIELYQPELTFTAKPVGSRPGHDNATWGFGSRHFKITLKCQKRSMTLYFSQGSAHTADPTLKDVLGCMLSDSSSAGMDFGEFCGEYGYDVDSRSAEQTWKAINKQNVKLERVLGDLWERFINIENDLSDNCYPEILTIEVTADDIANGKVQDECKCPIALATRRTLKLDDSDVIYVTSRVTIMTSDLDPLARFVLSEVACQFITSFDSGFKPGPFTFSMVRI